MAHQPKSLLAAIAANVEHRADNAALWARGETYSYRELEAVAAGIRDLLADRHIAEHSRVGVVTGDDLYTYASLLAIWSLNCTYVPINVHNPPQRNKRIIGDADLAAVLTSRPDAEGEPCLPPDLEDSVVIDSRRVKRTDQRLRFPEVSSGDLAYIFFTSGSTGVPKGVPISHGNLNAFMDTFINRMGYEFTPDDRFLQMFEMTFDLSVVSIFAPWYCGGCCYVVPDEGIAYISILNVLMEEEISVAVMVPSLLGYLQRFFGEISLSSMRLNLFCGEALTQDMVGQWSSCVPNGRIENVYGPTEATIFCTSYAWDEQRSADESVNGIVPIGKPMPGCGTLVVDANGNPCPDGERGELTLLGPQVMAGYWKNPDKTAEVFLDVPIGTEVHRAYRSGDIAFVNENGNLIYCGRLDSQVKIDGHRVELGEIEHCARRYIGSSRAAVILKNVPGVQAVLHLFVSGGDIDIDGLQASLEEELPAYMCPKDIRVLEDLPLNLNGKIDRPALAKMLEDQGAG